jgi:hypothetical protein
MVLKRILPVFFLIFSNTYFLPAQQNQVRLAWDPNSEPDLSHYIMYRDTVSGTMVYLDHIPQTDSTYTDQWQLQNGITYYYKIIAVNEAGLESLPSNEVFTTIGQIVIDTPKHFRLRQNYPNPFNDRTIIRFDLPRPCIVNISIYNTLGQKVWEHNHTYQAAGGYQVVWNGQNFRGEFVSSGSYVYQITAGEFSEAKRSVLQR